MLPDLILRYSSHRAYCKIAAVVVSLAILAASLFGRIESLSGFLWAAAPLLLLGFADVGYTATQRRCAESLAKGKSNDASVLLPEEAGMVVSRMLFALVSFSIWPFYLVLFAIVSVGGEEITKANREAATVANSGRIQSGQQYLQTANGRVLLPNAPPGVPIGTMPLNRPPFNVVPQGMTPPPYAAPPRFTLPPRKATSPQPASPPHSPSTPAPTAPATPATKTP